ncbi:hypothetical protein [Streptomyces botrytidirepellens]|uniref:Uncharacterized protein n=1 Tax=Streptomyces botrytidirepellens TaxID=2486417 RepID=A0A3M8T6C8_9ACTN|nr:hypothetical protein [Streptomyces botrytidirepellens]RNF86770.1 hypothetical protein EEJ42_42955 [Streptomyces botrytidirepellens]
MPAITRIDQIPLSRMIFPPSSHPDLQQPGPVHHCWNTGRQLLLHAAGSPLAKPMTGQDQPLRQQAIMHLRNLLSPHLDEVAGPLTLALHVSAVQQPPPDADTTSLIPLISEALADLGDWGIRSPLPEQLELITRSVHALQPCMPD